MQGPVSSSVTQKSSLRERLCRCTVILPNIESILLKMSKNGSFHRAYIGQGKEYNYELYLGIWNDYYSNERHPAKQPHQAKKAMFRAENLLRRISQPDISQTVLL